MSPVYGLNSGFVLVIIILETPELKPTKGNPIVTVPITFDNLTFPLLKRNPEGEKVQ